METINITPDPRILEVLTHNPMRPINALCELIDNSIDGFNTAKKEGIVIENQKIDVILPGRSDVESDIGRLVVRDNGPGLSKEDANEAVRAGFSGNEPIGSLGLFGLGFNISTGKLAKRTVFKTARKQDEKLFCVILDLPEIVKSRSFNVPVQECPKPFEDYSGVEVEISDWWEEGTANYGFIRKLISIGIPKLTRQLGRRYGTLLRKKFLIRVNDRECPIFNHCAWGAQRFVERRGYGRIPARFDFRQVLRIERRCFTCGSLVASDSGGCKNCGPDGRVETRECVIKGWVGIQRIDDLDFYGIDFVRNGRAILTGEKEAVFTWAPEATGEKNKEYPLDSIYGRIIGEVHIDHVPTNFLKTDFQRTSPEWAEVIKFLRGESSLLPRTQEKHNEPQNESPLYKLCRGYSRVRNFGRTDMYMGYWDESKGKPARISREIEKELYEKFLGNEPGCGPNDDSEWWKYVEAAEIRPTPEINECPNCGAQNLKEAETCRSCGHIFIAKKCIKCEKDIARSDITCRHCGTSQIPEEETEWTCACGRRNPPEAYRCRRCSLPRGVEDTLRFEYLKENASLVDELSNNSLSIRLPGNISMSSIQLKVYYVSDVLQREEFRLPAVVHCTANEMHIFIDQTHPLFEKYQDRPEDVISMEVTKWLRDNYQSSIPDAIRPLWSVSHLYYLIHAGVWGKQVELDKDEILKEVNEFFNLMLDYLPELLADEASSIFENMDDNEQSIVIEQLHKNNILDRQGELISSGEYLRYITPKLVTSLFKVYPHKFFDGKFWKEQYETLDVPDAKTLERIKADVAGKYHRCLEDMISFSEYRNPDINYVRKIYQTLRMVQERLFKK